MVSAGGDEIERLAEKIAVDLCGGETPVVGGDRGLVARTVAATLKADFAEEAAIYREAEQALGSMGPATRGMDRATLLAGIRERIAKKRGFVL